MLIVAGVIDIGRRKRLQQTQEELVATVSHELRTPMTSIAASLGLLLAGHAERLPPATAQLLQIAHDNCQRMVRMVNDILDLKKLDAGQVTFHFERCDIAELLRKAVEANRGFADKSSVGIRLEAATAVEVQFDPDRFLQVVTNLLSNAIKFSPPGADVVVALEPSGKDVRVTVRDYGPGIPDEFKPRVFETFAQADNLSGRGRGGSGLGLSIARKLITRMHGKIGFADAPGGGTVFYVELPGADPAARGQDESATETGRESGIGGKIARAG
jgi:signal transduction histidine kinase